MEILLWVFVFVVALAALVKGADWLLTSAEKIGLSLGLSPFIVGVVIVGLGTSFPELISSIFAVLAGATNIVAAGAVGSNIANILLVVGASALIGRKLMVTKSLIDLDLPLIAVTTVLFVGVAYDGIISRPESVLLVVSFLVYFTYTLFHTSDEPATGEGSAGVLPTRQDRRHAEALQELERASKQPTVVIKDYLLLVIGIGSLAIGAKYLIDAVIALSEILAIGTGAIALAAVAVGTSLPELLVSMKAAWQNKSEVALGNIFGSNVFNVLFVVGAPGLFVALPLDTETLTLGLPMLVIATVLFVISGISRRIHVWEGSMYLLVYIFFIGKLFGFL